MNLWYNDNKNYNYPSRAWAGRRRVRVAPKANGGVSAPVLVHAPCPVGEEPVPHFVPSSCAAAAGACAAHAPAWPRASALHATMQDCRRAVRHSTYDRCVRGKLVATASLMAVSLEPAGVAREAWHGGVAP